MEKYILKQFVAVFTLTKGASSPHKTLSVQMKGLSFSFFQPHSSADSGASKSKLVIFWLFFYFKRSRGRRGEEIVGDQGWGSLSDVNVFSVLSLWVAGFLCWSDNMLPLFSFFLTVCHSNTQSFCVNTARRRIEQKSDAVRAAWSEFTTLSVVPSSLQWQQAERLNLSSPQGYDHWEQFVWCNY